MANAGSRILFIVNPRAGRAGTDSATQIRSSIDGPGGCELEVTRGRGHATELAREAVRSGYDVVAAVGGDGTQNEVGRALVGSETAMGIVPAGSGNALARALGIPLNVGEACQHCLDGEIRSIDVGRAGDEVFLSSMGVGLDAEVCRRFHDEPGARGLLPYIKHTMACVAEYAPCAARLYLDGSDTALTCKPTLLTVANTSTLGYGAEVAPGADVTDGRLDVCILEGVTAARAALNAYRLFNGTFDRTPGFTRHLATQVRIERDAPGPLQIDGEAAGQVEAIAVSLTPGGLKVVVPRR